MEKLKQIIKYFLQKKERQGSTYVELARIILFLYLVDWHSAVKQDKTITGIEWKFAKNRIQNGNEIESAIADKTMFELDSDSKIPVGIKKIVKCIDSGTYDDFTEEECNIFNRVIEISDERNIIDLLIFALSTYPVISGTDDFDSNILGKAREYKQIKQSQN